MQDYSFRRKREFANIASPLSISSFESEAYPNLIPYIGLEKLKRSGV